MGILFGVIASITIGLSDLFNRRVAIQASVPTVALSLQVFALVTALTSLLLVDSVFTWRDVAIGGASGVAMATALGAYYVGVTRSTATVVAPIVGVLSSVLPFTYTLATGATAGPLAVAGALVALVGLALISLRGVSAGGGCHVDVSGDHRPRRLSLLRRPGDPPAALRPHLRPPRRRRSSRRLTKRCLAPFSPKGVRPLRRGSDPCSALALFEGALFEGALTPAAL